MCGPDGGSSQRDRSPPTPEGTLVGLIASGAQVVTSSAPADVTVIRDAATLQPLRRLRGGDTRGVLSPNGRLVAFGAADGSVRILDLHTGVLRTTADRHDGAVTDLRFTPDARTLLTAGADGRLIEWNVTDAQRIETFTGHAGSVSQIAIAPDGRTAYTAGEDGTVIAWDLAGDKRLGRPFTAPPRSATVFPGSGNGPTNFDPAGTTVPVAGFAVASTPDGRDFAVPDDAGYVDVFDSRTLTRTARIPVSPGRQVAAVALAPDGWTVAATTQDGHLRFGDLRHPQRLGPRLVVSDSPVWSLAFSGDGRWLATAGDITYRDAALQLWDVRHRRLVNTQLLSPRTAVASDVTFSPDGTRLAAAVNDPEGATAIEILSVPQLAPVKTLRTDAGTSLRFSPDGRLLVFGDLQGRVWLYDTHTWTPRGSPLVAHTGAVVTVSFSPDGRTLATTSDDGTTRLWDVSSARTIGTALPGPAQHYVAAAFVERRHSPRHLGRQRPRQPMGHPTGLMGASRLPDRWAHTHPHRMERRATRTHLRPGLRNTLTPKSGPTAIGAPSDTARRSPPLSRPKTCNRVPRGTSSTLIASVQSAASRTRPTPNSPARPDGELCRRHRGRDAVGALSPSQDCERAPPDVLAGRMSLS